MERPHLTLGLANSRALFANHSAPAICDDAMPSFQLPLNCDHNTTPHAEFQNISHTFTNWWEVRIRRERLHMLLFNIIVTIMVKNTCT